MKRLRNASLESLLGAFSRNSSGKCPRAGRKCRIRSSKQVSDLQVFARAVVPLSRHCLGWKSTRSLTGHWEVVSAQLEGAQTCNSGSEVSRWQTETDKTKDFLYHFPLTRTDVIRAALNIKEVARGQM